jgi:LysR family transcriptional regulator, cell division regulator
MKGNRMEIKDLEIFKEVANQKNITKTASKFNYVQSNITSRLAKLEKEVGTALLIRTNKGVALTQDGKIFLTYVDRMLHLHKEALQELNSRNPSGQLKIGATDITTAARLPTVLTAFLDAFPMIELLLKNGSSEELIEDVLNFNLDGAFITDNIKHPQIVFDKLIREELVLISNKEQPPIHQLKDITNGTILVFKQGCTYRWKIEEWISQEGLLFKKIEFGTIEGMIGCVKAGLGMALVSNHIAQQLNVGDTLQFHSVPEQFRYVETGFIQRRDVPPTMALQKFIATTKQYINETEK